MQVDILFVTATPGEAEWLKNAVGLLHSGDEMWINNGRRMRMLHTGIGMVNTALALGQGLAAHRPRLLVNFGIAGAFEGGPEIGEVVQVVSECYPELGAESPEGFLTLDQMGFVNFRAQGQDYHNQIKNPAPSGFGIRNCKGITVNTVHGIAESIAQASARWQPEVETMEGAAVFQACLMAGVPFQCYRGISNRVEPRDRANWRIREAAENVQRFVFQHFFVPES